MADRALASHDKRDGRAMTSGRPGERRTAKRQPAYDISEICLAGHRLPITCMVHNYSVSGALVETANVDLPPRFILANHARKLRAVCQIVWRAGPQIGVRFLTTPKPMG